MLVLKRHIPNKCTSDGRIFFLRGLVGLNGRFENGGYKYIKGPYQHFRELTLATNLFIVFMHMYLLVRLCRMRTRPKLTYSLTNNAERKRRNLKTHQNRIHVQWILNCSRLNLYEHMLLNHTTKINIRHRLTILHVLKEKHVNIFTVKELPKLPVEWLE